MTEVAHRSPAPKSLGLYPFKKLPTFFSGSSDTKNHKMNWRDLRVTQKLFFFQINEWTNLEIIRKWNKTKCKAAGWCWPFERRHQTEEGELNEAVPDGRHPTYRASTGGVAHTRPRSLSCCLSFTFLFVIYCLPFLLRRSSTLALHRRHQVQQLHPHGGSELWCNVFHPVTDFSSKLSYFLRFNEHVP